MKALRISTCVLGGLLLTGHSREAACSQPMSAVVTAGQTATITLTCVVP